MAKKIFLIAGEASGDALGAGLMRALKAQSQEPIEFSGIGGALMEAEGMESLLPMDDLCVMGLWEVLWQLPRLMGIIKGVVEEIEDWQPDAVITIDLPDFNFRVGEKLKKRGKSKAKLIHYVAPSVWAWRPKRAEKIAKFLDGVICFFPFEPAYFTPYKLRAETVGHPLIEHYKQGDGAAFRAKYQIPPEAKTLGLFFGSRIEELNANSETLKDAALLIKERHPDLHLVIPTLKNLEYEIFQIIDGMGVPCFVVTNTDAKWDAIAACDAAIAVSGTMGLELAYAGAPHVITYKMHPVTWLIVKNVVKVKYAHLANILLEEPAVPEFLQGKANPVKIGTAILRYFKLKDEGKLKLETTEKLREILGANNEKPPSVRAADFVLSVINS